MPSNHPRSSQIAAWILGAMLILQLSGCNRTATNRVAVAGTVGLDAQPLQEGRITLVPTQRGNAATGIIEQGRFKIPATSGPSPGTYRVEITAFESTGELVPDTDAPPGTMSETLRSMIPRRYNTASELTCIINADGKNELEFELERE